MKDRIKILQERKKPKDSITITVDSNNLDRLKEICMQKGFSVSSVFNMFLEDFVNEVSANDKMEVEQDREQVN